MSFAFAAFSTALGSTPGERSMSRSRFITPSLISAQPGAVFPETHAPGSMMRSFSEQAADCDLKLTATGLIPMPKTRSFRSLIVGVGS